MPLAATLSLATQFGGQSYNYQSSTAVIADENWTVSLEMATAWAGVLTTRTDANTGTITMSDPAHTISTGNRVDVYFSDGRRYGMTAGSVSGVTVPIDLGGGDDLPIVNSAVTAIVPQSGTTSFSGDNTQLIVAKTTCTTAASLVVFTLSDNTFVAAYDMAANVFATPPWFADTGSANPFAGVTIGKVYMSCADADPPTNGWVITSGVGYNN